MGIGELRLSILEGGAIYFRENPACRCKHGMAGGDVPLHGPAQPRITIGFARGHQAEFQGGAGAHCAGDFPSGEKGVQG